MNLAANTVVNNASNSTITHNEYNYNFHPGSIGGGEVSPESAEDFGPVYGVKSREHDVDRLEDRCEKILDLIPAFDGRFIRSDSDWESKLYPELREFLLQEAKASKDQQCFRLALDVHVSLAFAAGSILNSKFGRRVKLEQRGVGRYVWAADDGELDPNWPTLVTEIVEFNPDLPELAVAVGITHDVTPDVRRYCEAIVPTIGRLLILKPSNGCGAQSVHNGRHAAKLADEASNAVRIAQSPLRSSLTHLFVSVPNTFAFFLGQRQRALGPVRIYEYDFERVRGASYAPALTLPISSRV